MHITLHLPTKYAVLTLSYQMEKYRSIKSGLHDFFKKVLVILVSQFSLGFIYVVMEKSKIYVVTEE